MARHLVPDERAVAVEQVGVVGPASMAPDTATGAPNPAAPSMNAPNENAMNIACSRRSLVSPAIESLMTCTVSVWPSKTRRSMGVGGGEPGA